MKQLGAMVLQLDRASLRAGRASVLQPIDFVLRRGELVVVAGLNGSGKSTLLRLLAGVALPTSGARVCSSAVAYLPSSVDPLPMTPARWLRSFPRHRRLAVDDGLSALGFAGDLTAPSRNLSFGNRRKLLLAEALTSDAPVIVIDEASAGLDSTGRLALRELIQSRRKGSDAIVLSDHQDGWDWGEDRSLWLHAGVVTEPDDRRVVAQFVGPAESLDDLKRSAEGFGFAIF